MRIVGSRLSMILIAVIIRLIFFGSRARMIRDYHTKRRCSSCDPIITAQRVRTLEPQAALHALPVRIRGMRRRSALIVEVAVTHQMKVPQIAPSVLWDGI